jgi:hypothetical protein
MRFYRVPKEEFCVPNMWRADTDINSVDKIFFEFGMNSAIGGYFCMVLLAS